MEFNSTGPNYQAFIRLASKDGRIKTSSEISLSRYTLFLRVFQTYLQTLLQEAKNIEQVLKGLTSVMECRSSNLSQEIKALEMTCTSEVLEDLLATHDIVWEHPAAVAYTAKSGVEYLYRLYALKIESLPRSAASLVGEVLSSFVLILGPVDESASLTDLYYLTMTTETRDFLEKELKCQR